jgi:hypothetical protein
MSFFDLWLIEGFKWYKFEIRSTVYFEFDLFDIELFNKEYYIILIILGFDLWERFGFEIVLRFEFEIDFLLIFLESMC